MKKISLKEITDDILLLVRNNYISESEDLSRAQIHLWVKAYARQIWKEEKDRKKELARLGRITWEELEDEEFIKSIETGPMKLEQPGEDDHWGPNTKRTVQKLSEAAGLDVLNDAESSILAIHDEAGENIQYMNHIRRHYHNYRKYTYGDMTAYYKDDGHVYVQGIIDKNELEYIWVLALYEQEIDDEDDADDEDNVLYPAWLVPGIKERILKNELPFMLNRPSDDSNNATLASVKPHGPQDDEE